MKKNKYYLEWFKYAEGDLAVAKVKKSKKMLYETLCYHCQQTAEKAIKAIYIFYNLDFERTHDIDKLLKELQVHIDIPEVIHNTKHLSRYAVMSKYPGDEDEVDRKEYLNCIKSATIVLKWATTITAKKSDKLF